MFLLLVDKEQNVSYVRVPEGFAHHTFRKPKIVPKEVLAVLPPEERKELLEEFIEYAKVKPVKSNAAFFQEQVVLFEEK
jgi:hypothetical protein